MQDNILGKIFNHDEPGPPCFLTTVSPSDGHSDRYTWPMPSAIYPIYETDFSPKGNRCVRALNA